jgi:YidC/Oxa1 family membrane protein insertase
MSNTSNKWFKRILIAFATVIAVFGLSSCTKSFCTVQDKAGQLYTAYGNIYSESVDVTSSDANDNTATQNKNRETLYTTLVSSYGLTLPDKKFQQFMSAKATAFATEKVSLWMDGTLGKLDSETATVIARNVSIYSGITTDDSGNAKVGALWTNYDAWYQEALKNPDVGVLASPSAGYVTYFKQIAEKTISTNYSCITPVSKNFTQNGSTIYLEGKTWGEAFKEFGFLEGLFVYPFAWLLHVISESYGDTGWAQILAIFVVTIIARLFTVISTIFQGRTQAKQAAIQPQLNALQAKYPNSAYDRDQKQAMAMEQASLMKKNKVHPLLPMLFLIIQFPLFICVWSALQGSAALASGNWLGLSLTTLVSTCFTNYAGTSGALVGIFIFIFMSLANILSSLTGLWMNNWRTKNFGGVQTVQKDENGNAIDPNKTMKMMTYIMMAFVLVMGWNLPAAMGIYWFIGAVIAIFQSLMTEAIQSRSRHKALAATGDGTNLAAIRRSSHHNGRKDKEEKASKSDKPLWRK